ncbi:MAG: rhomboid family intramembrane serine protease [Bdellovibrio sp.]
MRQQIGINLPFSLTMKVLIGLNLGMWLLGQVLLEKYTGLPVSKALALHPGKVILDGTAWQLVTYMFLHSMQVTHLVLNMLMLWFMGAELEQKWGRNFFLIYYFASGVGSAILYTAGVWAYYWATGSSMGLAIPVVGASGAIFGLMLAYGILFGERTIHFMMIFPMKAKYFVMILAGIEIMSMLSSGTGGGEVAHLAHLGGLVSGYIALLVLTVWSRRQKTGKTKKKGTQLRLVVDNESDAKSKKDPQYWN